ncbi:MULTISPECIES: flagellar protein FlaG [Virgibacillus]|nr:MULTISPECIES: flagellar protein FlaG [Virgibacillus]MEB5450210.1 flagellar protein FlaG [Virgibacillus pantothenticus]MEB5455989.1 flagellar protein FlaG [Virgibacillus pantothenticus]MEB5459748.1 flagellar protein FlaG [Virgibacillus pantothenticus]MEB5464430.1 flagellar protein FlaG [Virgibacillus pantothenticus]MEB5468760.1 flagellar protein FlaG [Virgibacillus pantothenticus]
MDMRLERVVAGSHPKLQSQNDRLVVMKEAMKISDKQSNGDQGPSIVVTKDKLKTAVERLNKFIEPLRTDLRFKYHEKLNEYYVAVVNPLTDEIIKEIPPKKMLDMYADMAEFMGILIDEKI